MVLKRASGLGISTVVVDGYYDSTVLYISLLNYDSCHFYHTHSAKGGI